MENRFKRLIAIALICIVLISVLPKAVIAEGNAVPAPTIKIRTSNITTTSSGGGSCKHIVSWQKGVEGLEIIALHTAASGLSQEIVYPEFTCGSYTSVEVGTADISWPGTHTLKVRAFIYNQNGQKVYSAWASASAPITGECKHEGQLCVYEVAPSYWVTYGIEKRTPYYTLSDDKNQHQKHEQCIEICKICCELMNINCEDLTGEFEDHIYSHQNGKCICGYEQIADNSVPTIDNLNVKVTPVQASFGENVIVNGMVNGNGGTVARVRVSVFYNETLTSGRVYKDFEVNNESFDLSTIGDIVSEVTLAQDGDVLIHGDGDYWLAVFATNTNGNGQGEYPALAHFTISANEKCAHADYTISWVDGKSKSISITDNNDGATHTHVYTGQAVCNNCQMNLGMMEETNPVEEHRVKNGKTYYNIVDGGHQRITLLVCSCGYSEKPVLEEQKHCQATTRIDVEYIDDGNSHTVLLFEYAVCVCGKDIDLVSSSIDISGHIDQNNDAICDYCKGHCDILNTFYYDSELQYKIYSAIEKYSIDRANISQSFLDSLQVHTDNIAFRENTLYYGGIQHSPKYNQDGVMDILEKHGKLPSTKPQFSSLGETLAFLFGEYYDEHAADEFLSLVNRTGCFYTALSSTIFDSFEGRADEFEDVFGFPMYYQGHLNYDAVLVDFYCYSEARAKENTFGMADSWKVNSWIGYAEHHNVECHVPEMLLQKDAITISTSYIEECINNGDLIIIVLLGDYDLLDENGISVYNIENGGHAMVVTGIYESYVVVSSWGHAYLLDIDTVNNSLAGVYTIQY